jgi:hypothetical protein
MFARFDETGAVYSSNRRMITQLRATTHNLIASCAIFHWATGINGAENVSAKARTIENYAFHQASSAIGAVTTAADRPNPAQERVGGSYGEMEVTANRVIVNARYSIAVSIASNGSINLNDSDSKSANDANWRVSA